MQHLTYRLLDPGEHAAAVAFYETQGYRSGIAGDDVPIAAFDGDRIVGVVRLSREAGHLLLRGMFIDEAYQRQGVGTRMLTALAPHIGAQECWLLCSPRLCSFYGLLGFEPATDEAMPPHLLPRVARYRAHAPNDPMRRPAPSA